MKKIICFVLLLSAAVTGISAQQYLPEMGMAVVSKTDEDGLYTTHPTHPIGTKLKITNMLNNAELEVQVGGRSSGKYGSLIEICRLAAGFLGMQEGVLTQVRLEVLSRPASQPAMRPRLSVTQSGRALVQNTGDDLSAFHPSIPMNSRINLTNTKNGKTVTVTVKGRIQASKDRIVEITPAAAQALGIKGSGEVRLETAK